MIEWYDRLNEKREGKPERDEYNLDKYPDSFTSVNAWAEDLDKYAWYLRNAYNEVDSNIELLEARIEEYEEKVAMLEEQLFDVREMNEYG